MTVPEAARYAEVLIVLDSPDALRASMSTRAADDLASHDSIGPPLLWSEAYSAVREASRRRQLDEPGVLAVLRGFRQLGVRRRSPRQLYQAALELAGGARLGQDLRR